MRYISFQRVLTSLFLVPISMCLPVIASPKVAAAGPEDPPVFTEELNDNLADQAATIWGTDNVWLPSATDWVQYEEDLGERSWVDFDTGIATVQILIHATDDPRRKLVLAHAKQGVGNLILRDPSDPYVMVKKRKPKDYQYFNEDGTLAPLPVGKELRVYLVEKGDSLWTIAQKFQMKPEDLAKLNEVESDTLLGVGRPLKVVVFSSHDLTLDKEVSTSSGKPLLLDQIRMVDGSPVAPWMVQQFAEEVMANGAFTAENVIGADGIKRQAVTVQFKLVENHIEIRARRFFPLVAAYAQKHDLDPALIMAIVHTESKFNPLARSKTPAYGLMQLVPHSGGREAYLRLYGEKKKLTSTYLYDPENNIELGVAYVGILRDVYMRKIDDPESRIYCTIAAYNTGSANVGRAFIPQKSLNKAAPVINTMESEEVYNRLVQQLPFKEGRNYVKKVLAQVETYEDWPVQ